MKWATGILAIIFATTLSWNTSSSLSESRIDNLTQLGWYLFFDSDLSGSGKISCSTCHNPKLAFTDGYRRSFNAYGEKVLHNSPSLLNVADNATFNWTDHHIKSLRQQLHGPMGSELPGEMEFDKYSIKILSNLENSTYISQLVPDWSNIPECDKIELIESALVNYISLLNRRSSTFDKLEMNEKQSEGFRIFNEVGCDNCHGGIDFDEPLKSEYIGQYRIPTLRNVTVTYPYLHDGSEVKVADAIKRHTRISDQNISKIIVFLDCLTDTSYGNLKYFYDPFNIKNEI